MSTKHTPGEWLVTGIDPVFTDQLNIKTSLDGDQYYVAAAIGGISEEEQQANACLIAAAPELFAVLKAWVESTHFSEQTGSMRPVYDAACAAIRKATGGA